MTLAEYIKHGPYAWPGGYQINAVMYDGQLLCYNCCKNEKDVHESGDNDGWRFETTDIYWEGPPMFCSHCDRILESEYGDPANGHIE